MELSISKRDFLRGLSRTQNVADRKNAMAILANVLLSTQGDGALRFTASDLYLGASAVLPAKVDKPGTVAVDAKTLYSIVRNLPDGEVSLKVGDNQSVELRCGKVKFKIPGAPGEEFPPPPSPEGATLHALPAELIGSLIQLTSYSMSSDDTRPHLAGALFEAKADLVRMVTTDGHRLSKAERTLEGADLEFSMLVPHKGIGELKRLIEDAKGSRDKGAEGALEISVGHVGAHAFFQHGDHILSVKLSDEQFPPYERVIPESPTRQVVAARAILVEALKRISLVAQDKSGGVQLDLTDGLLRIQSQNPDVGEGSEELEVDYAGGALSVGFNARYLLDVLTALDHDAVELKLSGELDPGVVAPVGDGVDFVGVVMPMRI